MIYGDKREENAKDDRENIFKMKDEPILFTAMPCEVAESHMITVF